jgi:type IV secretion system protein VirB6
MIACPDFGMDGPSVSGALTSVDCHVDAAVAASYGRLFGSAGAPLGTVLTVLLTLYVAAQGLRLMTGRGGALAELSPRVAALGIVLTFATAWPAYQTVVYDLLVNGPDQITRTLTGSAGGAAQGFAERLDGDLARLADAARAMTPAKEQMGTPAGMNTALIWTSALLFLLASVGVLVAAKVVLGVLLALGPVFIVLALFPASRGLFHGWMKVSVGFALAPMFAVLSGSGALLLLEPAIDQAMAETPGQAGPSGPVVTVFVGSIVYAILVVLTWSAVGKLVSGWRPSRDGSPGPGPAARSGSPGATAQISASGIQVGGQPQRLGPVEVVATQVTGTDRLRIDRGRAVAPSPHPTLAGPSPSAAPGLGQSFRMRPAKRPVTAAGLKPRTGDVR